MHLPSVIVDLPSSVTASHALLVISLLTGLRHSHLDHVVATHAIVHILQPLAVHSPLRSRRGIYTLRETIHAIGISLGT